MMSSDMLPMSIIIILVLLHCVTLRSVTLRHTAECDAASHSAV